MAKMKLRGWEYWTDPDSGLQVWDCQLGYVFVTCERECVTRPWDVVLEYCDGGTDSLIRVGTKKSIFQARRAGIQAAIRQLEKITKFAKKVAKEPIKE